MSGTGKKMVLITVVYMLAKAVLNLILSPSGANVVTLIMYLVLSFLMIAPSNTFPAISGFFKYSNYITAVYLGLTVLAHISYNLSNLPGTWLYLVEALLDIGVIVLICVQKDARLFFKEK